MSNLTVSLDQLVPFSQARANLADLVDKVKGKYFLVVTKRQQPKVALVDTDYLAKLITVYQKWQRDREFEAIMNLATRNDVGEKQVMQEAIAAVVAVRKQTKKQ